MAGLAHELGHAENDEKRTRVLYDSEKAKQGDSVEVEKRKRNEANSIENENIVRKHYGIDSRKGYAY